MRKIVNSVTALDRQHLENPNADIKLNDILKSIKHKKKCEHINLNNGYIQVVCK